jgi:hypothetical protein
MVAPTSSSSLSGQAAIDHAAALAAAEERRRQAEEAARRAAEEARRRAEEARKLAEEARKKADEARKAAEAAEAKAAKSKDKVEQADADKLRTQANKDETEALKKEATANLSAKEEKLANSKLDDVRQRRAPNDPSEATRAAQSEVDAAGKTAALYDAPAGGQPAADNSPSQETQALLDKAEKAAKPVFEDQANGVDTKPEEVAAFNKAIDEWLAAAQQDMRTAAVRAQAQGKDPKQAIEQQSAKLRGAVEKGGVFDPASVDKHIDDATAAVKAESPAMRQLRSEQYSVYQDGRKQVADGRNAAKEADAAADKAEAYAKRFGEGPGGNDTIITAKQNAKDEATRLRGLSNEANARLDGLIRTYGGTAPDAKDPNKAQNFVGSVNADYNARVADLEVSEASKAHEEAKAGGDQKKIDAAQDSLDLAIDAQTIVHAVRDDAAAELERSDSAAELKDAEAVYEAEKAKQPQPYKVKHHGGFLQDDYETTELPEGYDFTFEVKPGSEMAKQVKEIDGKWYYVIELKGRDDSRTEMNPVTARLWAAQKKADAANANADAAAKKLDEVQSDLVGADGQDPKIDAARFLDDAGKIDTRLADANDAVATARANIGNPKPPPGVQGVWAPSTAPEQMGVALQNQTAAQKNADALKAMQELRQAQYDQAAGKQVDAKHMDGLRTKARNAQREAGEAQPKLTPEAEKDIADHKLPAARAALEAQGDKVTELTAPGSKATQAEKDAAQTKYDKLDLDVRDYETLLELEHAKQASLGAPYEYAATAFVRPQDSLFTEKRNNGNYGDTVGADIYADNYDPTWNIVPGADGKVKAEGLPRGISPDDVEVRYNPCGDGYTVHFKKNSEVLGRRSDLIVNYVVKEGTYEMHPATAKLWDATNTDKTMGGGRLTRAQDARQEVLDARAQMAADAPPAEDAQPLIGPDGKPVPTLHFADDLGPRKKLVDQNVVDANKTLQDAQDALDTATGDKTQLIQARDDANAMLGIAEAEQTAVNDALLWQEANRARQLYEANERAGRAQSASYAKPPREHADELHAKAETSRNNWYTARNAQYKKVATRELDDAKAAHDTWKKAHPGLSESGTDSWKALEAAKLKNDHADRVLAAGANEEAAAREYQTIAENLSPDQHKDPHALYRLFDKDPAVMAQSIINSHFVQYGGQPTQMENRTQLENAVATALGWQPSTELDPSAPATNERLRRTQDLFTGLGKEQKEMRAKIVDRIIEDGGEKARVTVLPVVYATDSDKGGIVKTTIFKVENKNRSGEVEFVDERAWTYDSLDDYRANNSLPVEGVKLAMPSDGNFTLDDKGNVKLFTGDARTETGWETFRRKTPIDWVVGGVGLVAGVVLTVGSFGTLSAPGVMLIAGSLTVLAAGYGATTSAQSLYRQGSHGQDINPFTSTQARLDWLNLGLSVASVPVVGASTRATMQAMRARNALQAALKEAGREGGDAALAGKHFADFERYTQSAQAWGRPTAAMTRPLANLPVGVLKRVGPMDVGSAYAFEEGARYLHDNWDKLTPGERSSQFAMLGLNASGFASPIFAKGYLRVHNATRARFGTGEEFVDPSRASAPVRLGSEPQAADPLLRRATDGSPDGAHGVAEPKGDALPVPIAEQKPLAPAEPAAEVDPVAAVAMPLARSSRLSVVDGSDGGSSAGGERGARGPRPANEAQRNKPADNGNVHRRPRSPHELEREQAAAPDPLASLRELPRVAGPQPRRGGAAWRITLGGEHALARTVNPTGSDTNCVNSAVTMDRLTGQPGAAMHAVPSAAKTLDQIHALYGDLPARSFGHAEVALAFMAALPPESRGFVVLNGEAADSHIFNFAKGQSGRPELVDAQAGRHVDTFDAPEIQVLVTHEGGTRPVDTSVLSGDRLARYLAAPARGEGRPVAGPSRDPALAQEMARIREELFPDGFEPGDNRGDMLFRVATQTPDELRAAGGVHPRPGTGAITHPPLNSYVEANVSGRWVSTSQTVAYNKAFLERSPQRVGEGETAYMYVLNPDARTRYDVLEHYVRTGRIEAIPDSLRETIVMEGEVAVDGAVPWNRIYGWAEMDPATGRFIRPFVRNPDYAVSAPAPRKNILRMPDGDLDPPAAAPAAAAPDPAAAAPKTAPAPDWTEVRAGLMAAPDDARTRFVVSRIDAEEVIVGGATLSTKRKNTYASFEQAGAAAAQAGGAWVHRVVSTQGQPGVVRRGHALPEEIEGALRVESDGSVSPVPVVKLQPSRGTTQPGARSSNHQAGESTGLGSRELDIDALLEGPVTFADPRPEYAGPATLAELEASTAAPTQKDIDQTLYLASAGSPDGHAARDIPLRRRFVQWVRGDAPHFLGAPDFVGGRYVLAQDAAGLNQGAPDASFQLLDRSHVYSSFESARAAAAQANTNGSGRVGVVRLIGPKTEMAEVVASGSFRNDQVDGIVGVRADGAVHPVSIANRNAAHAPKPGEVFVDPHSIMAENDKVYTTRDKVKLFAKTTAYMVGTGAAFYAAVRLGGGQFGWSMAGTSLATYAGARAVFVRYAFDAFLYRGSVAGLRQSAKIRLQKHLDPKHEDSFALIENIADPAKRDASLFQLKNQLDTWHATRRGIKGRDDYGKALKTLAQDPSDAVALDTLYRGALERSGRQVTGKRGWLNRVPPALRKEYAAAMRKLESDPTDAGALALLVTAPDVGRGTQYAGKIRGRVLRNVPGADRQRYADAVETMATSKKADELNAALKTLQGIPLDTVQRHTTGARGVLRGIPKADRQSIAMAAETVRVNPADARSQAVLDGSPGKLTSPNSPMGRTLFGMRVLSFGLSHSAGTRLYLNPIFDGPSQQWTWDITTLDGTRQWISNEGSLHSTIANATGLGATVAARYAAIYKARTGKDLSVRGEEAPAAAAAAAQAAAPEPAASVAPAAPAANTARPIGKNGKPVPVYKATDNQRWIVRFAKGLGNANAVKHPGVNDDGSPMVKPSFMARLPQYSSWGDSSGSIGMTIADALQGVIYAKAGQWDLVAPQAAKVLADLGIFRGTQKDYLDEYASNRGMGSRVYHTRWTDYLNAPLGDAKLNPAKVSDGWIRRGWPPLVVLGVAVAGRVLAEEWALHEKDQAVAQPPGTPAVPAPSTSPAPTTPPTTSPTTPPPPAPPKQQTPPDPVDPKAPQPDEYWIVDAKVRERSSFSRMAEAKAKRDHQGFDEALSQLFNLNPQYKRSLMDGYVDPVRLDDPDTLNNGTKIKVGQAH